MKVSPLFIFVLLDVFVVKESHVPSQKVDPKAGATAAQHTHSDGLGAQLRH